MKEWWSTGGPHATTQPDVEQRLLSPCASAWGEHVRLVCDRGSAGRAWVQAALSGRVGLIVRWKTGNQLLDNWGQARQAWAIARGKRWVSERMLREMRNGPLIKVGVVAIPLRLLDHGQRLWLVDARLGGGREPCSVLTCDRVGTLADAWAIVLADARRWQSEEVWRATKSELAFESPRVENWDVRQKLLLLASLARCEAWAIRASIRVPYSVRK